MADNGAALLAVDGITVRFGGVVAAQDVSFSVGPGEVVGLIGPNGAGKSTVLNCISGVTRPNQGRVRLFGKNATKWSVARRSRAGMGRTFQHIRLFASLTVFENIEVAIMGGTALALAGGHRKNHVGSAKSVRANASDALERLGLGGLLDASVSTLSPGQRRQLELARLIAMDARVLLLDEPSSGLNVTEAADLYSVITELTADDRAIVVVEHRLRSIIEIADRFVVLDRGTVLADGPTREVIADPAVQQAYLGTGGSHA
jgi:branched-chain amino acid transport system ATP-binding protein